MMSIEHAQWVVCITVEDEGRPQHKLRSWFCYKNFEYELHPPRHCKEDKRGQGEGQDGEGTNITGCGEDRLCFQTQELEESPIKTVLGSLARNSLASDTLSIYTATNSSNHRRRRKNQWRPHSIEDVPFR